MGVFDSDIAVVALIVVEGGVGAFFDKHTDMITVVVTQGDAVAYGKGGRGNTFKLNKSRFDFLGFALVKFAWEVMCFVFGASCCSFKNVGTPVVLKLAVDEKLKFSLGVNLVESARGELEREGVCVDFCDGGVGMDRGDKIER